MPFLSVTRRYRFPASHRLHSPLLTLEENSLLYGKCNNPYGHGHDYTLDVTVCGELDPATGRLVALEALDRLVTNAVLKDMAYRNLSADVDEFAALVPTTENMAHVIASRLAGAWSVAPPAIQCRLEKVRIYETRKNIFEAAVPVLPRVEVGSDAVGQHEQS